MLTFALLSAAFATAVPTPQLPTNLVIQKMDLGVEHACLLSQDGQVYCWGRNDLGQLGRGAPSPSTEAIRPVPGLRGVTDISVGANHTCALNRDGEVYCWGANTRGQLGDNLPHPAPFLVPHVGATTAITAGDNHTCAVRHDGAVSCWGDQRYGQLATSPVETPAPATIIGDLHDIVSLSAGTGHTCALSRAGAAFCWGFSRYGQTGHAKAEPINARVAPQLGALTHLQSGKNYTCATQQSSGMVWCWGATGNDQLGTHTPAPMYMRKDVAQISLGDGHACVRSDSGQIHCWGDDNLGQLGTLPGDRHGWSAYGVENATHLAAGYGQTCAILESGAPVCWGNYTAKEWKQAKTNQQSVENQPPALREDLPGAATLSISVADALSNTERSVALHLEDRTEQACTNYTLPAKLQHQEDLLHVTIDPPVLSGACKPGVSSASHTLVLPPGLRGKFDLIILYQGEENLFRLGITAKKLELWPVETSRVASLDAPTQYRIPERTIRVSCTDITSHPMCLRRQAQGLPTCATLSTDPLLATLQPLPKKEYAHPWFRGEFTAQSQIIPSDASAVRDHLVNRYADGSGCLQINTHSWLGNIWTNQKN